MRPTRRFGVGRIPRSVAPTFEFIPLPSSDSIDQFYFSMRDQKEETCGAYAASYLLRGLKFEKYQGQEISEDLLASIAGVNISPEEKERNRALIEQINSGAKTFEDADRENHAKLHTYSLPLVDNEEELGGSSEGVGRSIEEVSHGRISVVPISARGEKDQIVFQKEKFDKLVSLILQNCWRWGVQIILNLQCTHLLDPLRQRGNMLDVLLTLSKSRSKPLDSWKVGHFVSVAGFIFQNSTETTHVPRYFIIRDTYRKRGLNGVHLQPEESVRRSLVRSDGRGGGILLLLRKSFEREARSKIKQVLGQESIRYWDNGSPFRPVRPLEGLLTG